MTLVPLTAALLTALLPALLPHVPPALGAWPVPDPVVLSGFRPPDQAWGAGHRGVDLAAGTGTPVRVMVDGTVAFAGTVAGKPVLVLSIPGDRRVTYEPVTASVPVGARVLAGDLIGTVAATGGHCGGVHGCLHVGLRTPAGYADPAALLGRRPAVLKPR